MNIRVACGLTAAALSSLLGTQAYAEDAVTAEETPITLAGCIQRETEYRRQNNSGKGGFLGFGGGLGDEYVWSMHPAVPTGRSVIAPRPRAARPTN